LNFEPKNIFGLKELKMLEKYGLNGESAKGTKGVHNGGKYLAPAYAEKLILILWLLKKWIRPE